MSGICCVTNCRKRLERNKRNVKSFSFPNDVKRRKQWIQAVQSVQKNWIPSSFNRICNEHFKKTDFYTSDKSNELLLKASAVPTIFTGNHLMICTQDHIMQKYIGVFTKAAADMEDKELKTTRIIKPETIKHENEGVYTDADMIEETTEISPNVIEEYIIEEDPLHGQTTYKFAATSSKFYGGQEEASDSDEDTTAAHMETEADDTSLTLKLSKLISEENISSSCAEKLLSILKQHGHTELPKKTEELATELIEPENEEIEHMNKVLDYVAAEAKDIEAKIQFKLNFLSKCLNRIECKMQAMAARPMMDNVGGNDIFTGTFLNVFPIETMEKLTELEEKIDEDDELVRIYFLQKKTFNN